MPTRTARTAWTGTLEAGEGQVELTSSGLGTYDVSFPKRSADSANGFTSPEELLAAAHSACYSMQLSAELGAGGAHGPPHRSERPRRRHRVRLAVLDPGGPHGVRLPTPSRRTHRTQLTHPSPGQLLWPSRKK